MNEFKQVPWQQLHPLLQSLFLPFYFCKNQSGYKKRIWPLELNHFVKNCNIPFKNLLSFHKKIFGKMQLNNKTYNNKKLALTGHKSNITQAMGKKSRPYLYFSNHFVLWLEKILNLYNQVRGVPHFFLYFEMTMFIFQVFGPTTVVDRGDIDCFVWSTVTYSTGGRNGYTRPKLRHNPFRREHQP